MLDRANAVIQNQKDLLSGFSSYDFVVSDFALVTSFKSFVSSPLFGKREQSSSNFAFHGTVMQSMERLLKTLAEGYEENCKRLSSSHSKRGEQAFTASSTSVSETGPLIGDKSRIMDLDLDMNDDSQELDTSTGSGKISSDVFSSVEKWKLAMVSLISGFFSVHPVATWDILFQFLEIECDSKVC